MDIREIVMTTNMSARPGYYAGRGAEYHDLNSEILSKIANLIKKHYGDNAHDNYVSMVWQIESLSASAFLNNLYALAGNQWNLSETHINESNQVIESHDEGWGLIAATLASGSSTKDLGKLATNSIRRGFRKVA